MVSRDGSNKRVIKNLNTIRTNYSYLNNSINRLDFYLFFAFSCYKETDIQKV